MHFMEFLRRKYVKAVEKMLIFPVESNCIPCNAGAIKFVIHFCPSLAKKPLPNVINLSESSYASETLAKDFTHSLDGSSSHKLKSNQSEFIKESPFINVPHEMQIKQYENHLLIFNKFPVFPCHLLLVTRSFELQTDDLNESDFEAVNSAIADLDCPFLMFYNCGLKSGASQLHKHIQIIPFKSAEDIPFNSIFSKHDGTTVNDLNGSADHVFYNSTINSGLYNHASDNVTSKNRNNFYHWLVPLKNQNRFLVYKEILTKINQVSSSSSYNILMTSEWMFAVIRSEESHLDISINSLGFAGFLLAKSETEIEFLKKHGILSILKSVSLPIP